MSQDPRDAKKPAPFHSPFAALSGLRTQLPEGAPAHAPEIAPEPAPRGPARAVVRLERKGRRGKEVTVVEQLALPAQQLEVWLKALKGSLGCGGAVEGDALVLQGDHRERAAKLLETRGVRKVISG